MWATLSFSFSQIIVNPLPFVFGKRKEADTSKNIGIDLQQGGLKLTMCEHE